MALSNVFSARDLVSWRPFAAHEPGGFGGTLPAAYHPELVAPPRVYGEEPFERFASGSCPMSGALWAEKAGTASTINLLLRMKQSAWPSWNVSTWKFDGATGGLVERQPRTADGITAASVAYDRFTSEPMTGRLWWFGVHATANHAGIVEVNTKTLGLTGTVILLSAFDLAPGLALQNDVAAFALDHVQKRAYVRWTTSPVRCVHAYDLASDGTWTWSHDIYAGSAVDQVLMTDTGVVYLIDENDWLAQYSASGSYLGAVRNPRTAAWPFGYLYGWDRLYRRLLFLAGTENDADGASTLRVQGFYPVPEVKLLTRPVPLTPPRKGRRIQVVSQVAGEGGEPIAAVNGVLALGGAPAAFATADRAGDLVFPVTPIAAGPLTAEVTAPWP